MAFCAICGRDHPVGPCAGNPIEPPLGSRGKLKRSFDPEFARAVKKKERLLLLAGLAVIALAIAVIALIT